MYMISSSIENILHIFHFFLSTSSIKKFVMSTKTFILSKTEKNYFFHRILFSEHWSYKSFQSPFCSLRSKLFRKFKFVLYGQIVQKFKGFKGARGARGANYFSLFIIIFIFIFHSRESVFTCKIFFFHYHFYFHLHSCESVFS